MLCFVRAVTFASQAIALKSAPETGAAGAPSNKQESFSWKFHDILHNAGQDTVYETLCADVVSSAVSGTNGTIMAYGQVCDIASSHSYGLFVCIARCALFAT